MFSKSFINLIIGPELQLPNKGVLHFIISDIYFLGQTLPTVLRLPEFPETRAPIQISTLHFSYLLTPCTMVILLI